MGINYQPKKINIRNLGSDKILVISDPNNKKRRNDFIKAWEHFDGFDYMFIDSVFPKDFKINQLLEDGTMSGEWIDLNLGKNGQPGLTENMIGIGLAHLNAWKWADTYGHGRKFLILEDDARPSDRLLEDIYNGTFKHFEEQSRTKYYYDIMWIGKTTQQIIGKPFNDYLQIPEPLKGIGAHAYILDKWSLWTLIGNYKLNMPVDLYLEWMGPGMSNQLTNVYSPYFSYVEQYGHLIDKWLSDDPDDEDFIYSTGSQVNTLLKDNETLSYPWEHTSPLMRNHCHDEVVTYMEFGYEFTKVKLKTYRDLL